MPDPALEAMQLVKPNQEISWNWYFGGERGKKTPNHELTVGVKNR